MVAARRRSTYKQDQRLRPRCGVLSSYSRTKATRTCHRAEVLGAISSSTKRRGDFNNRLGASNDMLVSTRSLPD